MIFSILKVKHSFKNSWEKKKRLKYRGKKIQHHHPVTSINMYFCLFYFSSFFFLSPQSPSFCDDDWKSSLHSFLCNCHFQPCDKMPLCGHMLFIRGMLPDGSPRRFFSFPINGQMGCFHFCCFVFAIINNTIANIFFFSLFLEQLPQDPTPETGFLSQR